MATNRMASIMNFRLPLFSLLTLLSASSAFAAETDKDMIRKAAQWAAPVMGSACDFATAIDGNEAERSAVYYIPWRYAGQGQDEPDNQYTLVRLYCFSGAYNEVFVYVGRESAESDFKLLSFSEPKLAYDYTDENFNALKAPPKVVGYLARTEQINSDYDPATKTIFSGAKWRGIGDAWSSGSWEFIEGEFVLKKYEVDPTYDANADKPVAGQPESYTVYPEK
ncbi:DUF1176 domain-containing protein [Rhizobium alvei]|uniref:DUF1176 domain-containing protein n=1 Tax=Rhizobium alvei TaxID=1132659 RepID=A0ABT8YIY3_9HYPH|nr:DUF1176 domain-containing protein [Rhizobium alvei]MDO6963205.1 DUF1176 domain-containing protein [Rhizobium alvei]